TDNPAWNCTALMLITPPRWLQSDSSIHPARRRSCDWRLKVRANQEYVSVVYQGVWFIRQHPANL
ncbi:hypothetical protein, partial [Xanthomonas axonopodis]|uniref:hypothetical protein n=1 Tax=Xanthomonas axonopodis TaxID=53413 RepID=UPI001C4E0EE7